MGLNLNKGDENNAKPGSEKKGLNLKKSNDTTKSSLNLSKDNVEPKLPPSSPTEPQTDEKKKSPLLLVTAAVVLIGLGIFWFMNRNTPSVDGSIVKDGTEVIEEPVVIDEPVVIEEPVIITPTVTGTIEEKAIKVMNGEFGNGAERKNALGTDYAEIQAKVNEMYRNR